jgi:ribonuclease BN (tRNA processing enzyme)
VIGSIRLQFVGCGDAFAGGGRFNTCLLLAGAEEPLLLDCGASSLVALKAAGIDPAGIGCVALSHLHGDHFGGLPFVILDGQFSGRTRGLVIAGPPGTGERVGRTFEALYPGSPAKDRPFDVRFLELREGEPCPLGPAVVTPFEVPHSSDAPSYALRVLYGSKVITYSGDTGWTDNLLTAARGADLFVCECNFFDTRAPNHLDYRTLIGKRDQFECRRIVLTHMSDEVLARLDEVQLETAIDRGVIEL